MLIKVTPKVSYNNQPAFSNENLNVTTPDIDKKRTLTEQYQKSAKKSRGIKGVAADISYAWVNVAEGFKGVVKGLWYGFLAGTLTAGISAHLAANKLNKKEGKAIGLLERFSPKNMTKSTKILSGVVAGGVFVWNLIWAKMKANQRTANVDHMLYTGHR